MSEHRLYRVYRGMLNRCNNPNSTGYENYGGRGIKVCDRWLTFNNFIEDMFPSFQEGLQLDRTDNDKDYSPDNCKWVTSSQQNKNKRNKAMKQSDFEGISYYKKWDKWLVIYRFKTQEEAENLAQFIIENYHV